MKNIAILVGLFLFLCFFAKGLQDPLTGNHKWRQADTLFASYFFCEEDPNFFTPRIAHRGSTDGVSIGEFPLYSFAVALPCLLTGQWSDVYGKILSLFAFLALSYFWAKGSSRHFFGNENHWILLFGTIFFSSLHLEFLARPFPDSLALLCLGLAVYLWRPDTKKQKVHIHVLCMLLCTIGFLIRPYLAPLLIFIVPNIRIAMATFVPILATYIAWYKYWVHTSSIQYYRTHISDVHDVLQTLPEAIRTALEYSAVHHVNILAVPLLLIAFWKWPKHFLLWAFSILLVIAASDTHFIVHGYYLLAASVLSALLIARVLVSLPATVQASFITLYVGFGLWSTYDQYLPSTHKLWERIPEALEPYAKKGDPLVTLSKGGPELLYYMKSPGWNIPYNAKTSNNPYEGANRKDPCKGNAKAAYWINRQHELTVVPCEK